MRTCTDSCSTFGNRVFHRDRYFWIVRSPSIPSQMEPLLKKTREKEISMKIHGNSGVSHTNLIGGLVG